MAGETILVVDDERDILELVRYNLEKEGFKVSCVLSGYDALAAVQEAPPDMILLDLMLPDLDGLDVCRRLKEEEKTRQVPIVMVSAKGEDTDIILGLEMGADDYITKPFSPKILLARIRSVLRRLGRTGSEEISRIISIHGISIDSTKHEVSSNGRLIPLSVTEYSILEFLAKNPGWVFSRSQIITAVRGDNYSVTERSVDVQVLGLRKKLDDKKDIIETVRGVGYRMMEEDARET
jgi:two-component system, OmpR family, alkaline phosphatase synthesis response regulator PhoP